MEMNRCPAPDLLLAAEQGVLSEETTRRVRQHTEGCGFCLQLLRDLHAPGLCEPSLAELERVRRKVFGYRSRTRHAAWAACLLAAAGLGVWVTTRNGAAPETSQSASPASLPAVVEYRLPLAPAPLRLSLDEALVFRGRQKAAPTVYLEQLGEALAPYRAGDYRTASMRLGALASHYPRAVEPAFYLGVSRLMAGDARAALTALEKAREIGGEALDDDITWYLAVAHERNGEWQASIPLLSTLCKAEGPYHQAACAESGRP